MSVEALPAVEAPAVRPAPVRWLVSPKYDLCFFIGSCVFTFLFFALYKGAQGMGWFLGGDQILVTYFVFTAFFRSGNISRHNRHSVPSQPRAVQCSRP